MNIALVDIDGKLPNLALARIASWHHRQGDRIELLRGAQETPLFHYDRTYVSTIFRWNKEKAERTAYAMDTTLIGGTGYDRSIDLPPEIAATPPDTDLLYDRSDTAYGFISRGCIRKCAWCVVPSKEGAIRRESSAEEIVGAKGKAMLLDNNFLAMDGWEHDAKWLADKKVEIGFPQALDARLIDAATAKVLARCKWKDGRIHLAADSASTVNAVKIAVENLSSAGHNRVMVLCLIGRAGMADDISRMLAIHNLGVSVFPMGFRDIDTGEEPATGWPRETYRHYRRLISRMPDNKSLWAELAELAELGRTEQRENKEDTQHGI